MGPTFYYSVALHVPAKDCGISRSIGIERAWQGLFFYRRREEENGRYVGFLNLRGRVVGRFFSATTTTDRRPIFFVSLVLCIFSVVQGQRLSACCTASRIRCLASPADSGRWRQVAAFSLSTWSAASGAPFSLLMLWNLFLTAPKPSCLFLDTPLSNDTHSVSFLPFCKEEVRNTHPVDRFQRPFCCALAGHRPGERDISS